MKTHNRWVSPVWSALKKDLFSTSNISILRVTTAQLEYLGIDQENPIPNRHLNKITFLKKYTVSGLKNGKN